MAVYSPRCCDRDAWSSNFRLEVDLICVARPSWSPSPSEHGALRHPPRQSHDPTAAQKKKIVIHLLLRASFISPSRVTCLALAHNVPLNLPAERHPLGSRSGPLAVFIFFFSVVAAWVRLGEMLLSVTGWQLKLLQCILQFYLFHFPPLE